MVHLSVLQRGAEGQGGDRRERGRGGGRGGGGGGGGGEGLHGSGTAGSHCLKGVDNVHLVICHWLVCQHPRSDKQATATKIVTAWEDGKYM